MRTLSRYFGMKFLWTILTAIGRTSSREQFWNNWNGLLQLKISGSFAGMESTLDPSNDDELDRRTLDQDKQTISAFSE